MSVSVLVEAPGGPVRVILAGRHGDRVSGKFVFGRLKAEDGLRVLVFDDSAEFHKDIAAAYGVEVSGGGWIEIDRKSRTVQVGGKSTQYGRELDRGLTVLLLERALEGFSVDSV
jgi:hypothetical protein